MSNLTRVLRIPAGSDHDEDGRKVGDDWLLATLGCDDSGATYYVTTDRVRCSEMVSYPFLDPATCARVLAGALNGLQSMREYQSWRRRQQRLPYNQVKDAQP